jgi:transcriptional regulator with XRE-family HTH domain
MESIGTRIRSLRKSQKFSLKQVAELVGCTPSYLSMVENDKLNPSVSRFKKIADAMGTTIIELLAEQPNVGEVVLRKEDRQRVAVSGSKLLIEILVHQSSEKQIDARLAILAPRGSSEGTYSHKGEEFGFIVKGTLELTVDDATYILREGDTFNFQSNTQHRFQNSSDENVEILWVNHPPSW